MKIKLLKSVAGHSFSYAAGEVLDTSTLADGEPEEWIAAGIAVETDGMTEADLRQRIAELETKQSPRAPKTVPAAPKIGTP